MKIHIWPVLLRIIEGGRTPDKAQRDMLFAALLASARFDGTYRRDGVAQWRMWRSP